MSCRIENSGCIWPNNRVPYVINNDDFPITNRFTNGRKEIEDAITAMNDDRIGGKKYISLVKKRSNDNDFIEFQKADESCSSRVGRQGGCQVIGCNVGPNKDDFGVGNVMHEICHALGLYHEHSRPDRDDFLVVDSAHSEYNRNHRKCDGAVIVDNYDFGSIMHYPLNSADNPNPLRVKGGVSVPSTITVGQRNGLSNTDKLALLEMKSGNFLGATYDQSGYLEITIQRYNGAIKVKKGQRSEFIIPNFRFWWYSGSSREWTTTPRGTDKIVIYRARSGRRINWYCYNDSSVGKSMRFLGNTHDMCSSNSLKVFEVAFPPPLRKSIIIRKGQTRGVNVQFRTLYWNCGRSKEYSTAPKGTNYVVVTRAPTGRSFSWACYKK